MGDVADQESGSLQAVTAIAAQSAPSSGLFYMGMI